MVGLDWRSVADGPPTDVIDGPDGRPYMERYQVGPNVRLHHILKSDLQDLHDHPWDYRTEILDGSYVEVTERGEAEFVVGDVLTRPARAAHRLVVEAPVWTLFHFGRFRRRWGYHTPEGWVHHRAYGARPARRPRPW